MMKSNLSKPLSGNKFLGQKSPWTNIFSWQTVYWTKIPLDKWPLDKCLNTGFCCCSYPLKGCHIQPWFMSLHAIFRLKVLIMTSMAYKGVPVCIYL